MGNLSVERYKDDGSAVKKSYSESGAIKGTEYRLLGNGCRDEGIFLRLLAPERMEERLGTRELDGYGK